MTTRLVRLATRVVTPGFPQDWLGPDPFEQDISGSSGGDRGLLVADPAIVDRAVEDHVAGVRLQVGEPMAHQWPPTAGLAPER